MDRLEGNRDGNLPEYVEGLLEAVAVEHRLDRFALQELESSKEPVVGFAAQVSKVGPWILVQVSQVQIVAE
jgi:hypothetical protein